MDRTMKSSDDEAGRGPKDDLPNPARNSMTRRSQLSGSAHKSGQAGAAGTTGLEPSTLSLHSLHVSEISVHVYIILYLILLGELFHETLAHEIPFIRRL